MKGLFIEVLADFFHADQRRVLRQRQGDGLLLFIMTHLNPNPRCACLAIPAPENGQIALRVRFGIDVLHRVDKIIAGDSLSVMAAKVFVHPIAKTCCAQQGVLHADDFGPFFVYGCGVEIADRFVTVRAYRMRHGTGIFRKLAGAQNAYVVNAFDGAGTGCGLFVQTCGHHVGRKFLIAENRQAFLEA